MRLKLADESKFSTGFTKVDGKYYPKRLRPWDSFADSQCQQHFNVIKKVCGETRFFDRENTTRDNGEEIPFKPAGDESAIDHFEKVAVESPVWKIMRFLREDEQIRTQYGFTNIRFNNNVRDFTQPGHGSQFIEEEEEGQEEEQPERRQTGPNKRVAAKRKVNPSLWTKPNGCGIQTRSMGQETLAFVYDYKAAHKVAVKHLRPAVTKETLFMEVMDRVNSNKSTSIGELKAQEDAEALIAMALTQVFDYMLRHGVAYGYVAAGKSLLLLYVDSNDLQTLYCHPCIPSEDVGELSSDDWAHKVSRTSVAQLASFCLLSLQSEALQGDLLYAALETAEATLRRWGDPYDPEIEDTDSSSAPSSQSTDSSEFISAARPTDRKIPTRPKSSCKAAAVLPKDRDDEERPDKGTSQLRIGAMKRKKGQSSDSSNDDDIKASDSASTRQYCTQACLLGLKRGWDLDGNCPNILSHRTSEGGTRHPIDAQEFARLVDERLRRSPYQDCLALSGRGKMGAIGLLFKLQLTPYGYTFVGKGTLPGHLSDLQHEGRIYAQLERLQGKVVPVHLGLVHLGRGYVLPGGARIVYMMLMSWGGEGVTTGMAVEVDRSTREVWAEGVSHGDERNANMLWNDEHRRVMVIDFDRATLRPPPSHRQLLKLSKKRKRDGNQLKTHAWKRGFHDRGVGGGLEWGKAVESS